jgi:hypothetical protein
MKEISGCWDLKGRIRCQTGRAGEEPRIDAAVGERVVAIAAGTDGSDIEFIVATIEFRPAAPGRNPVVYYTPVTGSVIVRQGGFTPDSSEEQLAREAQRDAGRTGEMPGA